jgi:O-antigen ligase
MLNTAVEKRLSGLIAWGSLGVTLVVTDRIGTDPVNIGKMLLLVVIAGGCFGLTANSIQGVWRDNRVLLLTLSLFLLISLISVISSDNPWERGFYGAFGRNTGLLTYLALSIIFLSVSMIRTISNLYKIILALLCAGFANLIYCLFASQGIEIFRWNNPYGSILGTFGNPNFISAFLGIFVSVLVGLIASNSINRSIKLYILLLALVSLYAIKETNALQGFIVVATGISIVTFFYLRSIAKNMLIVYAYVSVVALGAILGLLGTLQKGPLASLLYKPSVSFRGEYWRAGLNMGNDNLLTGVGMDSYGTYYRAYRAPSAIIAPGVNVTTDAAHNVFIDIFSGIGIFGLICYLTLLLLVAKASIKLFKGHKTYDPIFVILFTSWFTYQLQSIISINQIGLAVWGWVLGGAIIAYSQIEDRSKQLEKYLTPRDIKNFKKSSKATPVPISAAQALSLFMGLALGLVVALPPFLVDAKTRNAFGGQKGEEIISAVTQWPQDSARMNRAVLAFANSGLGEQAQSIVSIATQKFPSEYSGWYSLFKVSVDGSDEKAKYLQKLHELDPYNPEFAPK